MNNNCTNITAKIDKGTFNDEEIAKYYASNEADGFLGGDKVDSLIESIVGIYNTFLPKSPKVCSLRIFRRLVNCAVTIRHLIGSCNELCGTGTPLSKGEAEELVKHVKAVSYMSSFNHEGGLKKRHNISIPPPGDLSKELTAAYERDIEERTGKGKMGEDVEPGKMVTRVLNIVGFVQDTEATRK